MVGLVKSGERLSVSENKDIGFQSGKITEALKKLPRDRIWGSVRMTFMDDSLIGQAICLKTQYTLTWDPFYDEWSDNSIEVET